MLPSLLLVLARPGPCRFGRPTIPIAARRGRSDSSLAMIVASGISSIKPAPNTGVGIRKITFFRAASRLKSGWARTQPAASVRPAMVNRSWTPPSRVRSALNLNRASRTGPLGVMKEGTTFFAPSFVATAIWGLTDGLEPPVVGCTWHPPQLSRLNRGPRPFVTASTSRNAASPA